MSSERKTIVHIGLGDAPPGMNMTDAEICVLVQKGADTASTAHNLDVQTTFVASDSIKQDPTEAIRPFKEKLSSLKPYGVVVGGGVRLNAAMTPFFEQILEVVREEGEGKIKLGFQCSPGDMGEVCRRCFI